MVFEDPKKTPIENLYNAYYLMIIFYTMVGVIELWWRDNYTYLTIIIWFSFLYFSYLKIRMRIKKKQSVK